MKICQYQFKQILKDADIPVPNGHICYTEQDLSDFLNSTDKDSFVVTTESLTGKPDQCIISRDHLSVQTNTIKTHLAEQGNIPRFFIEEIPEQKDKLSVEYHLESDGVSLEITTGTNKRHYDFPLLSPEEIQSELTKISETLPFDDLDDLLDKAYRLFYQKELLALTLSPVVKDKNLIVLNGFLRFDDSVPQETEFFLTSQKQKALANDFRYFQSNGQIGCLVNGTGMMMSTLDMLSKYHESYASLLDVGTHVSANKMATAVKMILSERSVEKIFINLFAPTSETLLKGLIPACHEMTLGIPILIRLTGLNASLGERILRESKLPFIIESDLDKAVQILIETGEYDV